MTGGGGRAALVVGAGILLSRLVGLLRNTAFAWYFGAGPVADAYNAAFRIPNAVRNVLGEGTISASFGPVPSSGSCWRASRSSRWRASSRPRG
jgi:putative peptidoglycan lipid II flippase